MKNTSPQSLNDHKPKTQVVDRNFLRLQINQDETIENVNHYVNNNVTPPISRKSIESEIRSLINKAQLELQGSYNSPSNYAMALDTLQKAHDLVNGITWTIVEGKHADGTADLIRDARWQEMLQSQDPKEVERDKNIAKQIETMMRSTSSLRAAAELISIEKLGKETDKIRSCRKLLTSAMEAWSKEEDLNKAMQQFLTNKKGLVEYKYNQKIREAVKSAGIKKHKDTIINSARRICQIENNQYHTTTVYLQKDKDGKDAIVSESNIMMLGMTQEQRTQYKMISDKKQLDARVLTEEENTLKVEREKEINKTLLKRGINKAINGDVRWLSSDERYMAWYNKLSKYDRSLVAKHAKIILDEDKVLPESAAAFTGLKNPRVNITTVHKSHSEEPKLQHIEALKQHASGPIASSSNIKENTENVKQLQSFFAPDQKLDITLLGTSSIMNGMIPNVFSSNRDMIKNVKLATASNASVKTHEISLRNYPGTQKEHPDIEKDIISYSDDINAKFAGNLTNVSSYLKSQEIVSELPIRVQDEIIALRQAHKDEPVMLEFVNGLEAVVQVKEMLYKRGESVSKFSDNLNPRLEFTAKIGQASYAMNHFYATCYNIGNDGILAQDEVKKSSINIYSSNSSAQIALSEFEAKKHAIAVALEVKEEDIAKDNTDKQIAAGHTQHIQQAAHVSGCYGVNNNNMRNGNLLPKNSPLNKLCEVGAKQADFSHISSSYKHANLYSRIKAAIPGFLRWAVILVEKLVKSLVHATMDIITIVKEKMGDVKKIVEKDNVQSFYKNIYNEIVGNNDIEAVIEVKQGKVRIVKADASQQSITEQDLTQQTVEPIKNKDSVKKAVQEVPQTAMAKDNSVKTESPSFTQKVSIERNATVTAKQHDRNSAKVISNGQWEKKVTKEVANKAFVRI